MQDLTVFIQNHSFLCLAFIAAIILLLIVEYFRVSVTAEQVNPAQLVRLMNHNKAVVIDIRPTAVFAEGHIIDAISMPATEFSDKQKKLIKHKTRPLVIVCGSGTESQAIANTLNKDGYDAYVLQGGIKAWKEAEMPIIKGN